ncbi:MAG: HAMP domain-containing sensor histidine kinase [Deltaproteobacteria bacterium]|nr:HAMP domain-containing sensor histidine kinase [Deltaproteobacteria bacterium]
MFEKISRWLTPPQAQDREADLRVTKNRRLLVSYLLVITGVVFFFSFFDLATGKLISARINLAAAVPLLLLTLSFRFTDRFVLTSVLAVVLCQLLLGAQHLYAPDGLLSNLFWPPLLTILSVHLLGRRDGLRLGLASSLLVLIAGFLRPRLGLEGDPFSEQDIFEFHLVSLALMVVVGGHIAGRLATEVDQMVGRIEGQRERVFDLYETNSALLSMIGHDLNNHLMVVDLRLSLVEREISGAPRESCQIAREQLDRVMKIVEQTNAFNAMRTGKLSIRPVPVCLPQALLQTLELFERDLERRHLSVETRGLEPGEKLEVIAEPFSLVSNVLANVVSNAIKFSPDNASLVVEMERGAQEVLLRVSDQGAGIPPDLLPHVFDFGRPTTRRGVRREKGTGFGMPILKMFMERYGGSVEAHSEAGKPGTTLVLRFKRPTAEAA